jgi:hypothetical protein
MAVGRGGNVYHKHFMNTEMLALPYYLFIVMRGRAEQKEEDGTE